MRTVTAISHWRRHFGFPSETFAVETDLNDISDAQYNMDTSQK